MFNILQIAPEPAILAIEVVEMRKVALVIGGSGSVGKAAAAALRDKGYQVVISARDKERLEAAREEIAGKYIDIFPADATDSQQVEKLFKHLLACHGPIKAVVLAQGFWRQQPIEKFQKADFEALIEANLTAAALVSAEAAKFFKEQGFGTIIAIGSHAASKHFPGQRSYVASKAGLRDMILADDQEFRRFGARAIIISPSTIRTPENERAFQIDWRKAIEPKDLADFIACLAELPAKYHIASEIIFETDLTL